MGEADASLHDLIWTPVRLPLSRSTRFGFEDVFGTPDRVALAMGEIMAEVGGDGFMISAPVSRRYVAEITDGLVPELHDEDLSTHGLASSRIDSASCRQQSRSSRA